VVGKWVGRLLGEAVGESVPIKGEFVGTCVGLVDDGCVDGAFDGSADGLIVGSTEEFFVGSEDNTFMGLEVGVLEDITGLIVGSCDLDGRIVGYAEGTVLGEKLVVGAIVPV